MRSHNDHLAVQLYRRFHDERPWRSFPNYPFYARYACLPLLHSVNGLFPEYGKKRIATNQPATYFSPTENVDYV